MEGEADTIEGTFVRIFVADVCCFEESGLSLKSLPAGPVNSFRLAASSIAGVGILTRHEVLHKKRKNIAETSANDRFPRK